MRKTISAFLILFLTSQLVACGTILYPNRRGQTSGRIDPGVAILDGVGLLFFIIPGAIAFGVDFTTGAIYLPAGHHSAVRIPVHPHDANGKISKADIERAIHKATGKTVQFSNAQMRAFRMSSLTSLKTALDTGAGGSQPKLALLGQSTSATITGM